MFNIFLTVFFATLAFAFVEPYFFIGYLISIALFGLYQAIFMANAGGAWDNAKKIVETELKQKGTPLHDATVVGDTVGDPFKDTSSVAMNPIIKFTTLFGLLAVSFRVAHGRPGGLGHASRARIMYRAGLFGGRSAPPNRRSSAPACRCLARAPAPADPVTARRRRHPLGAVYFLFSPARRGSTPPRGWRRSAGPGKAATSRYHRRTGGSAGPLQFYRDEGNCSERVVFEQFTSTRRCRPSRPPRSSSHPTRQASIRSAAA
jgi:hypothetical protein